MRCFYCENILESEVLLTKEELAHIFKVNKIRESEKILLTDCHGKTAVARIDTGERIVVEKITIHKEPEPKLHLFLSPPRKNQLDQIIEQSCEVGIWSIHLLITERSVSILSKEEKLERIREKLIEGCKQSQNPFAPTIFSPISLKEAVRQIKQNGWIGYFGSVLDKKIEVNVHDFSERNIAWIVGPEGGFSIKEEEFLILEGVIPFTIGKSVMRVETAAITGAVVLMEIRKRIQSCI